MDVREYSRCDAVGLAALIRAGEVSAAEVHDAARSALEGANAVVNGLAGPLFEKPLAHDPNGPFAGVPFLLKDVPLADGVEFSVGTRVLRGIAARGDSDLMRRFRAAGLAALGVTTMPEFGLSFATESVRYGITRNPWNPDRGVGGSSGGSAALVAAGAVPVAHGNDGAGSLRVPASCCGLVGLKPSRGRVPCGPAVGEAAFGTGYEFVLCRTVRDAAHVLDAVAGPAAGDRYTAPPPARPYRQELEAEPGSLRIAYTTRSWSGGDVDARVAAAVEAVAGTLGGLGHDVAEASPSVDWETLLDAGVLGIVATGVPFLSAPRPPDPDRLEAVSRRVLALTGTMSALDLVAALDAQNRLSRAVGAFFTGYDLLLTPTLAGPPLPHGALRYDDPAYDVRGWLARMFDHGPFTMVFNQTGQPAVSLPLGETADGLPIGVQLVAGYGREDLLLRVAARLEEALPWRDRRPPHHVAHA